MKMKPKYTALGLDIILTAAFYAMCIFYVYTKPDQWFSNAAVFVLPLVIIVGVLGLRSSGIGDVVDTDPKHRRKYTKYFKANSIVYFGFMLACASLVWYWWAALFLVKFIAYVGVSSEYEELLDMKETEARILAQKESAIRETIKHEDE